MKNKERISRGDLLKNLRELYNHCIEIQDHSAENAVWDCMDIVRELPEETAAHAEWLHEGKNQFCCPYCDHAVKIKDTMQFTWKYCPWCGKEVSF